jgi:hypothetical protein
MPRKKLEDQPPEMNIVVRPKPVAVPNIADLRTDDEFRAAVAGQVQATYGLLLKAAERLVVVGKILRRHASTAGASSLGARRTFADNPIFSLNEIYNRCYSDVLSKSYCYRAWKAADPRKPVLALPAHVSSPEDMAASQKEVFAELKVKQEQFDRRKHLLEVTKALTVMHQLTGEQQHLDRIATLDPIPADPFAKPVLPVMPGADEVAIRGALKTVLKLKEVEWMTVRYSWTAKDVTLIIPAALAPDAVVEVVDKRKPAADADEELRNAAKHERGNKRKAAKAAKRKAGNRNGRK